MLQPGTYYIKVSGYASSTEVPIYILDIAATPAAAPTVDGLIINEYLANDATADANCDLVTNDTSDEFVEIVNVSPDFVDLTGLELVDGFGVRHTFAASGLPPGGAVVVFAGGTPTCPSFAGGASVLTASSGTLGLNNTGSETITVRDAALNVIAVVSFSATTAGISANLAPDATDTVPGATSGVFAAHNTVEVGVNFSPATYADGTPF
jgi:hypothetical protein